MPLSPDITEQVLAAARQNAADVAAAFTQAFDRPCEMAAETIQAADFSAATPEWNGAGLAITLQADAAAAVVLIAAASGLLPPWMNRPDADGQNKLDALARQLGSKLLPATLIATDCRAAYVENLAAAVARAGIGTSPGAIQSVVRCGDATATLRMIWPAASADAVFVPPTPAVQPAAPPAAAEPKPSGQDVERNLPHLPSYIRSLLQIKVPVSVLLATTKQPVSRILNIGPGSIIQFDKNCEKPITLCVGDQSIAEGEAVKVGEKFGMKLTAMVLPGEKFIPLQKISRG